MKHIVLYFTFTVVLALMAMIIINQKEKPSETLLSVQQYYSYLYTDGSKIEIPLYLNDVTHPLLDEKSYLDIELCNNDESKKIEMALTSITLGYEQSYLNENFQEFFIQLEMPDLGEDFWIDDLWIKITLVNDDFYWISLGSLSIKIDESNTDSISWMALEGRQSDESFLARLQTIHIDYENQIEEIDHIEIGHQYEVAFTIESNQIVLTIPYANQLLNDVPIFIYFKDGTNQNIYNFRYMIDYDTLSESGLIIKTYALN